MPGGWRLRGRIGQRVGDHDPSAPQPVQPSQVEQRCAPLTQVRGRSLQPLDSLAERARPRPNSIDYHAEKVLAKRAHPQSPKACIWARSTAA